VGSSADFDKIITEETEEPGLARGPGGTAIAMWHRRQTRVREPLAFEPERRLLSALSTSLGLEWHASIRTSRLGVLPAGGY
jgi:hypothetical protein